MSVKSEKKKERNISFSHSAIRMAIITAIVAVIAVIAFFINQKFNLISWAPDIKVFNILIAIILILSLSIVWLLIRKSDHKSGRKDAEQVHDNTVDFLLSTSHSVRTPMNAILGYTDYAIRHKDEPDQMIKSLNRIKSAGGYLQNLIDNILEIGRIESGRAEMAEDPIDLRILLSDIERTGRALASSKNIEFTTRTVRLKNPYVFSDEMHLNMILINLITNAMKFTDHNGQVICRAAQLTEFSHGTANYRFTISDNGIGISEDFKRQIYRTFRRENITQVAGQEGAGLGLALAKRIVDLAGGTISFESIQGQGTTFTVDLSLHVMDDVSIEIFKKERSESQTHEGTSPNLKGKKILLVEDNATNREIAEEILTEAGLDVETARDGAAAVRAVTEMGTGYYDAILMDIEMPIMNGYDATKKIRNLSGAADLPIIALSANVFEEDIRKSKEAGMNDHISKPINVCTLFEHLSKFM